MPPPSPASATRWALLGSRLTASVNLIVALGGGWDGLPPAGAQARADNQPAGAPPAQP